MFPTHAFLRFFCLPPVVSILFLLPAAAPAEQKTEIVVVTAATAAVQRGTMVLTTVNQGQRFRMSEVQGEWYRIHFRRNGKTQTGWVHQGNVRVERAQERSPSQLTPEQAKRLDEKNVADLLDKYAELHQAGRSREASLTARELVAICREVLGKQHRITATWLNNMGLQLNATGDYAAARACHEQALAICRKVLGKEHPNTATALNNLGSLLKAMGDYAVARKYYEQALAIRKKVLGEQHPFTAASLNNLGLLLRATGDYAAARPCLEQALKIYRKVLGEQHRDTASTLNNLGSLLSDTGDYAAARKHYEQALAIRKNVQGEQHPDTSNVLNNLASLLQDTGDYATARKYYEQALAIRKKVLGEQHPDTASTLNNLGALLKAEGDHAAARTHYEQSLAIWKKVLGNQHPDTATALSNLGLLLQQTGDSAAAAEHIEEARHIIRQHVARVLPGLSQAEQLRFLTNTDEAQFHAALSLGRMNLNNATISALSAGWLLNGKAVAHEALAQRMLLARESTDPAAAALLQELQSVRSQLARQSLKAIPPNQQEAHRKQLAELEAEADQLTRKLGQLGIDAELPEPWVELDAVRARIPDGAVLIDVARFQPFDFDAGRREQAARYTAWIIPAAGAGEIRIVDLGEADAVEAAVKTARTDLEQSAALIRTQGEPEAEQALRQPLEELSKLLLRPLLAATGEAKQLILSPDAQLWLVPWSALSIAGNRYLIEDYQLSYVVSGRDLVTQRKPHQSQPPLILADPDFGPVQPTQGNSQRNGSSLAGLPMVQRLPGTAAEARAIRPRIATYTGQTPVLQTGTEATEAAFRTVRRPEVLTLSTHGFFLPDQEVKQTDEGLALTSETRSVALTTDGKPLENPLLRCGLLLAGCNTRSTAAADSDDGVLTGLEIVGTDLRGTKLVVLSACETGLGDVRNGEGVAGLRQAFQLAGAESIVATLWQVPDRDTARLMVDFFEQLAAGKSRSKALRNAQLARIRAHRERYGAAHPFFWAAVTLTGEWR